MFCFWKTTLLCPSFKNDTERNDRVDAFSLLNRWECINRLVAIRSLFDRHVCTSKESVFDKVYSIILRGCV